MGFFKGLKEMSDWREKRKQKKEARKKEVNQNPTEEELKNNKKGKLAYLWTAISIVVYLLGFFWVASVWENNIGIGIMSLIICLMITPLVHRKAISLAQEQRQINGKGRLAYILALILPLIVLMGGGFFFFLGGMYIF